jgi:hypothetical protein
MALRCPVLVRVACFIFCLIALFNFYNGITIFIDSIMSRKYFQFGFEVISTQRNFGEPILDRNIAELFSSADERD